MYKLSGAESWEINFRADGCNDWSSCQKTLYMKFGGTDVIASGKKVKVDEDLLDDDESLIKDGNLIFFCGKKFKLRFMIRLL